MTTKTTKTMKRGDAAKLIDRIRVAVVGGMGIPAQVADIAQILADAGIEPLVPCTGAAHSNPHIDNCGLCAPRWGFTGARVEVR